MPLGTFWLDFQPTSFLFLPSFPRFSHFHRSFFIQLPFIQCLLEGKVSAKPTDEVGSAQAKKPQSLVLAPTSQWASGGQRVSGGTPHRSPRDPSLDSPTPPFPRRACGPGPGVRDRCRRESKLNQHAVRHGKPAELVEWEVCPRLPAAKLT